jgi:hypothetical protein
MRSNDRESDFDPTDGWESMLADRLAAAIYKTTPSLAPDLVLKRRAPGARNSTHSSDC